MSGTPDLERGPSDKDSKPPLPVLEDEVAPDDMDPTPPRSAPGNEAAPDQSGNGDGTNGEDTNISETIRQARTRADGYIERIRKLPHNTLTLQGDEGQPQAIWDPLRVLNSEVNVHLLSVLSNGNIDQDIHLANIKELQFTLESFLESSTAEQTSEPKYYIVEDPSPEVIKIFGGYLDIPPSFFYAHMADSAMEYTEITGEAEPVFLRDMNFDAWLNSVNSINSVAGTSLGRFIEWGRVGILHRKALTPEPSQRKYSISTRQRFKVNSKLPPEALRALPGARAAIFENSAIPGPRGSPGIITRTVRPFQPIGLGFGVTFKERVSIYSTPTGGHVLVLVDQNPVMGFWAGNAPLYLEVDSFDELSKEQSLSSTTADYLVEILRHRAKLSNRRLEDYDLFTDVAGMGTRYWNTVLHSINCALDGIDHAISENGRVNENVSDWRLLLGCWRSSLPQYYLQMRRTITELESSTPANSSQSDSCKAYTQLEHLMEDCRLLQERVERTSQALMAAVSIMESQNAIAQGHQVQKLTELAFIFIPLSFAASYFGMEVAEFESHKPRLRSFWAVGGGLVGGLYILRVILYSESYRSLRSAYITDLAKFTINRKSQVNVKGGYDKRYRLRDIAFHFFAVLLLHRAPIAVQLFWMLVVLIAAPIILFWTLTRREWPDYSRMLFTLGWGWSSFAVIRSVLYHRRVKYAVIKSFKMTYGLAVVLYTLAFPGLIINFGDISQTEAWNPKYRLSIPFVVWPVIAILLYLIWDWLYWNTDIDEVPDMLIEMCRKAGRAVVRVNDWMVDKQ